MVATSVVEAAAGARRPLAQDAAGPAGAGSALSTAGAKVLIVEDDAIIAMAVADELRENGFDVVAVADNGPEAIALAARHRPALLVVDVRLRGQMNGIVAARHIKELQPTRVVFASAHIDMATRSAMAAVGCDAILAKPYTPEQLLRVVRSVLAD